ncbi:MAG: hypothetical protein GY740_22600, partial [Gammaproteobacteria bacterium]|nr:hypothetical protein [Gammaproteobacteria bacterium]
MESYNTQLVYAHDPATTAEAEEYIQDVVNNLEYDDENAEGVDVPDAETHTTPTTTAHPPIGLIPPIVNRYDRNTKLAEQMRRNNRALAQCIGFQENRRPTKDGLPLLAAQDPALRDEVDELRMQ